MSLHFISPDLPASFIVTFIAVVKSGKILLIRGLHESGVPVRGRYHYTVTQVVHSEAESVSVSVCALEASAAVCCLSTASGSTLSRPQLTAGHAASGGGGGGGLLANINGMHVHDVHIHCSELQY